MYQVKKDLSRILERYGRNMSLISVTDGNEELFKGFLQPLRYKNKMYLNRIATELSYTNTRKFLLICAADVAVETADGYVSIIEAGEDRYCIDHSEKVFAKGVPVYSWSIVHQVNV